MVPSTPRPRRYVALSTYRQAQPSHVHRVTTARLKRVYSSNHVEATWEGCAQHCLVGTLADPPSASANTTNVCCVHPERACTIPPSALFAPPAACILVKQEPHSQDDSVYRKGRHLEIAFSNVRSDLYNCAVVAVTIVRLAPQKHA